jgi:hypothetical protein
MTFAIWPKMSHILPKFKIYLNSLSSSRDLFLPLLTLVGRSIKSGSGCYLGLSNYIGSCLASRSKIFLKDKECVTKIIESRK